MVENRDEGIGEEVRRNKRSRRKMVPGPNEVKEINFRSYQRILGVREK